MVTPREHAKFVPLPCPKCGDVNGVVRSATTFAETPDTPSGMNIRIECPACHYSWLQPMPAAEGSRLRW